ncbi:MAG: response regulator [Lachnospiraceae bacterium]|nr:response regulator [Lachnospiraceae bacterium]
MRFVAVGDLQPGMKLARKIVNRKRTSMLEKGMVLTGTHIIRLQNSGYLGAYISDPFSEDIKIAETVKEETFQNGVDAVADASISDIMEVAHALVRDISSIEQISIDLLDLRSFDDYTYHHSVNVAVYATAVATLMGLDDEEIQEVAVAALCHDLGKAMISPDIINKKGRLTDEEFEEIKNHSRYSYEILYSNPLISTAVRQAVLCHHENLNGSGYPLGKMGDEIPLYAKIIHAVDIYDALTSRRPYKEPYAPVEALEYMTGGVNILFDENVVRIMQKVIPAYPPGMDVGLSNGEKAVVIANTPDALRPRIRIYGSGKEIDLSSNLQYRRIFITASGVLMHESKNGVAVLNENRGQKKDAPKRIVVVDDSPISLEQTKAILGEEYDLILLGSGVACLNYFKAKGVPDLLIMDIEMPMMDGIKTTDFLKKSGYEDVKIMFLTAVANKDTVLRCNAAGALDYILKPVNPIYLKERVRIALDKNLDRE